MTITQQPTLPPEDLFTDPEFNFMEESPRGFFPENQDSNWGLKRKVFSDVIWELNRQLHTIYSEIFPTTSQTFLDEWEETTGLPQNPASKTLGQRRQAVLNRLRGGPFTRTQRRNIVESYITATFGGPIIFLPPGVEMLVGGQPLYNEPGDVKQLYMILETVEQFKYEVRIKTGMALDQVGLERDLRWFTPAGLFIIFNYGWEGKFPVDSGTLVDSISGRKITATDFGIGSEGIRYTASDTGVGTEISNIGIANTQLATSIDTGTVKVTQDTVEEFASGIDLAWVGPKRMVNDYDFMSGTDNGIQT
jgi:Bacteriophage Mu-like, Gp48